MFKNSLKIKNLKFKIALAFFTIVLLSTNSKKVWGQTLSLSLWPPLLEVMIQPGRTITQVYKLTNNSEAELQITPVIYPFEPRGEKGEISISYQQPATNNQLPTTNRFFSFVSGEKFNQSFPLTIGQTRELTLKISIPPKTPENDYYYTLLFSTSTFASENRPQGGQTASITQIGSNILLTVSQTGKPPLLGRILLFSAPVIIDSFSSVKFEVILENWGKTFFKPFGKIKITGILKQKEEIPLLEQNILANSTRQLTISSFRPKLPVGPFKANLEFSLNENSLPADWREQKLSKEVVFWYLPYKLTFVAIVITVAVWMFRKLKKRKTVS